jgi:ABC-2 type transport system permease protein
MTLIRKLLRDYRVPLLVVMFLLAAFQCLWAKISERILGTLTPLLSRLSTAAGLKLDEVEDVIFEGPGKVIRTLIGGELISLDRGMDMMTIAYVHPLMLTLFCIWGIGRAAGAIAGEIDRGTMELLLAQPIARSRLVLAHLGVDLIIIPVLCLSVWAGTWLGVWMVTPIHVREIKTKDDELSTKRPPRLNYVDVFSLGAFKVSVEDPMGLLKKAGEQALETERPEDQEERLRIEPAQFWPGLVIVGGLVFAVSGATMWLSALGRYRWRVLGLAVLLALVQFIVNLVGQMWDQADWLRPLSIFYYFRPQQVILRGDWCVTLAEWNHGQALGRVPMPLVLYGVGLLGYALALWSFRRRDLPAPL